MLPDERFLRQPQDFWAHVRSISQTIGYTSVPTLTKVRKALESLGLNTEHVLDGDGQATDFGQALLDYFAHRSEMLLRHAEPNLLDAPEAKALFDDLHAQLTPTRAVTMNKQKGEKKAPAYLTGIINMLIEANVQGLPCDYDPRRLTTVTRNGVPVRTLARRVDGAFPSSVNPVALWEIKEYYYTTTFGSRVADGVYETLLDEMELEELREHEGIDIKHYLMVDSKLTWWKMGRSYLCRMVDMLHMGYVDEVMFGREVLERFRSWSRSGLLW